MSDEKHFTPSNSSIECTGCEGKISNLISTTPTVFVKKQPMATIKDKLPTSFKPFPSCSLSSSGTCTPSPIGKWKTQDVLEKIDIQKQTPIIEGNYIKCFAKPGTGIITISEKKDTPPPPENIVDKAQNKINKAANYATKKITEITKAASNAIGGIADTAKKAGGFLNNESIQGAVSSASDLVDNIDRKKAELDVTVANANIRLNNLRKELKELITGEQQQLQDLMTINDSEEDTATPLEESPIEAEPDTNNTPETEAEEYAYNQDFFNETNRESVNALMDDMQSDLDTLNNSASRLEPEKDFTIETDKGSADSTRLFTESGEANATSSNSNSITTSTLPSSSDILQESISNNDAEGLQAATDRYNETNAILQEHGVTIGNPEDKQETIQSLVLLDNITEILEGGPNASGLANNLTTSSNTGLDVNGNSLIISEQATSNVPNLSLDRNNEKTQELNTKVQAKIDELLQEVEYLEKLQKYQQESKELQEDLDRSAAALDVLGDFGAFVDGIAAEYLGELADEYKEVMDQIGKNMSRLNDSLRGASFIAGGLKAGDVITHAPDLEKPQEEEEEEGPPPELPPPPPPQEIEEEEEEGEEEECTLTKLTVIKNNTLEYVVIEKDEDKIVQENPLDKPITFVAGTIKNIKTLSLEFKDLDCSSCSKDHEEPKEYLRDGETEKLTFLNNTAKISIKHTDNQFGEFIFGDFIDILVLGWKALKPIDYNIPINLCNFSKTIQAKVYIDAKWHLLVSISRPSTELSIQQTIFDLNPAISQFIPSHHPGVEIDQKDHPGGVDIKIGVGAIYDSESKSFDLYNKFNTQEIKDYAKKIYAIISFLSIFSEKVDEKAGGEKKEKVKKTPLSKITGISFTSTPPNLELKLSASLEEKTDDPFFGIRSYTELDISSTLFKLTFEINIITFARKHPWIIIVEKFIEGVYSAYNKAVKFLNRDDLYASPPTLEDFIEFKIGLEGFYGISGKSKITGENKNFKITGNGGIKGYVKFSATLETEAIGVIYTAKAEAGVEGTVRLESDFVVNKDGISSNSTFIVDPVVLEATMSFNIQGWKITGVIGSTFNSIKNFFSDDEKIDVDEANIKKGDSDDEYLIDINLAPEEPWKLTLYDGFTYPIGSIS